MANASMEHITTIFEQAIISRRDVETAKDKGKTSEGVMLERKAWASFNGLMVGFENLDLGIDDVTYCTSESDKMNAHLADLRQRRLVLIQRCEVIEATMQQPNPEYVKAVTFGDSKIIEKFETVERELLLELHTKQKQLTAMNEGESTLLLEKDVWERMTKAAEKSISLQALALKDAEFSALLPQIEKLRQEMDELCSKTSKAMTHREVLAQIANPPRFPLGVGANPFL